VNSKLIIMIDYGASNIRSAQKAFEHIGAEVVLTEDPEVVRKADKLVLPGVGAFGSGMAGLRQRHLPAAIQEAVQRGVPFLGICVGMQLMFTEGHEMGIHRGLDLIAGKVTRFPLHNSSFLIPNLKVPHMGWNQLEPAWEHPLLAGVKAGDYAYFVHSYYCDPAAATAVLAWTEYGLPFAAVVGQDNIFGLQFHPEKSQGVGLRILQNFIQI
jgi:glutamine amidotransferase